MYYMVVGSCQTFALHQGCYDGFEYSPTSCSGRYEVFNVLPAPSRTPSAAPTGPSLVPSVTPRSTTQPTGPSQMPSFTSSVNCGDFTVFYPDTAPCLFTACGGQYLSISSTYDSYGYGSHGYAYLQLFDSSGELMLSNDYSIELTTPVESACQTYTLQQGCSWNYYYCTGRYTVYGGEPILSFALFRCLLLVG